MPLTDPVALVDHGVFSAIVGASGNGTTADMFRPTSLDLRADIVPVDGFGFYVDGVRIDGRAEGTARDRGWRGGVGVHGAWWLGDHVGIGAIAEGAVGQDWSVDGGVRSAQVGRVALSGSPSLVVGTRGEGAYAWLGPEVSALARLRGAATGGGLEWPAPPVHVGVDLGGELISDDLLDMGRSGEARARVGATVRAGASWGLTAWVGASW